MKPMTQIKSDKLKILVAQKNNTCKTEEYNFKNVRK
jgi:hypothetical protein